MYGTVIDIGHIIKWSLEMRDSHVQQMVFGGTQ